MSDFIQAIDKPFDEMTRAELELEQRAHRWVRYKVKACAKHLSMRLYALRNSLLTREEYTRMYADGEITQKQFQTMAATMARKHKDIYATEAQIEYSFRIVDHETAIITDLQERIKKASAVKNKPKKAGGSYKSNPRKRATYKNPKPWLGGDRYYPPPKVQTYVDKRNEILRAETDAEKAMSRMQAVNEWDYDRLKKIAADRGWYTDPSIAGYVAQELRITVSSAQKILKSGKMSWGQAVVIGAAFEMTPAEFCDTFLHGYFREAVDGKWVAVVDDKEALLARTIVSKDISQDPQSIDDESEVNPFVSSVVEDISS